MKKKKNDLKKLKFNKNVVSHFEKQQIQGGTLLTAAAAACTTRPVDIRLYSKFNEPCDTRYCVSKSCEPTEISCSGRTC